MKRTANRQIEISKGKEGIIWLQIRYWKHAISQNRFAAGKIIDNLNLKVMKGDVYGFSGAMDRGRQPQYAS